MTIGYIGIGNMGGALAARLQLTHPLVVFDPSEMAMQSMAEKGARLASDLHELAAECDMIFLCLPTSRHVRDVIFGDDCLRQSMRPGTMIVDQSTGDPNETRAMSAELARYGIDLIDAPVSGGKMGAEAGTIAIMVGASPDQYNRVFPILSAISTNIFHAGGIGNGQAIKLVNNLMSIVQRALSFEAVALAAKNGVDPHVATDILLAGGGSNAYLEKMMKPRVLEGKLNVGFTLGLAHKDIRLACQLGIESGVPMFLGNITREIYQTCISEMGASTQVDAIGLMYNRLAGTTVVPDDNDLN
jgi:3-hydroxyisobutyrate dehydrogenase